MKKVIRLTEDDLTRLIKRVIKEESIDSNAHMIAEFIDSIKDIYGWSYNPSHPMREFALIPTDIGYDGFKHDSFRKYVGKPLIFNGKDEILDYCYIDKRNNIVLKHLDKKTTYPLKTNIKQILSSL